MVVVVGGVGEFLSLVPLRSNVDVDFLSFYYTSSVVVVVVVAVRSIFLAGWLKKKKKRKKIYAGGFQSSLYRCSVHVCVLFHSSFSAAAAASLFPSRIRGGRGVIFVKRDAGIPFLWAEIFCCYAGKAGGMKRDELEGGGGLVGLGWGFGW